jgi:hypothetical protein
MFNSNCASVPLVANIDGNNGNGMFGGDGLWGLIIILALLGWGGNGFGGFGGFGGGRNGYVEPCATQADVRAAVDQQTLISKLDQQTYGLADSTYALNNAITNGFFGVQSTLCQGFNGVDRAIADCCCATQRAIDGVNYNMATQACDIKHAINDSTRAVLDFLTTDKIATLQAENQNLKLQASQAAQNAYLLNELKPCPQPAYITCNPFTGQYGGYGNCGCGCV